ncbi:hypothetical protein [Jiangella muralis]|uniref:hypothetical protein n=1 Tax=Jiangella muralis TaxID=702383 RepID=UPI00069D9190|nr:hypothetical protein [Jiangella muralis]
MTTSTGQAGPDTETPRTTPPAAGTSTASHDREEPIRPPWMRDGALVDTVRTVSRRKVRTVARHSMWAPGYALRLLRWFPRGLWRAAAWAVRTTLDAETSTLQHAHAGRGESAEFVTLERVHRARVHDRLIVAGIVAALVAGGAVSLWLLAPRLVSVAVAAVLVLLLGWIGRPKDRPLLNAVPLVDGAPPPMSAPMVTEALARVGIGGMNDADGIGLLYDVARTAGGYQVGLELPAGVTATKVIAKREELSAALRRELGTVWPTRGKRHEGHLELYVADEPVSTARQRPWALMDKGQVNIFDPVPLFTDQRGHWMKLLLAYTSGVIGGLPRMGKTFVMRQLGLVFALDPRCVIYAYDLKGTGDFGPLSLVAHGYGVGDEPDDMRDQLVQLRGLHREMRRRVKEIRNLAESNRALCPENKITDQIASMRDLRMGPVLLLVDECQVWFEHPDKATREELIQICTDLVKRGPAVGIHSYFGTQKPDASSIPTAISANAAVRFSLKVMGQPANDAVLGTGAYKTGINATVFAYEDKGMGYLRADGAEAQIVRSVFGLDGVQAEKIGLRARAAREAAGLLSGYAAGEDIADVMQQVDFLTDCRTVVGSADTIHLGDLAAGLAALREPTYGSLTAHSVGRQLRELGIEPKTVWDASKPRGPASGKGVERAQLNVSATDPDGDEDGRE